MVDKTMNKIGLTLIAALLLSGAAMFYAHTAWASKAETVSSIAASTNDVEKGKVLVAYFTWPEPDGVDASTGASRIIVDDKLYGNTEYVAHLIAQHTGGELFAIKTERTYPLPHLELIKAAKAEQEAGERPQLATHIKNLEDYDIIFVGYPNWWYDMPMAIYTFFDEYDFSGKTVIPFVTSGGSNFSQSVETITGMEKGAKVIKGPAILTRNVQDAEQVVVSWLKKQGLNK